VTNTIDNQLIKRKGLFWLRFAFMTDWLCSFGPVPSNMVQAMAEENHSSHDGGREREKEEETGISMTCQVTPPMASLPPTRPCPLKAQPLSVVTLVTQPGTRGFLGFIADSNCSRLKSLRLCFVFSLKFTLNLGRM
jgi:hypothetical protein